MANNMLNGLENKIKLKKQKTKWNMVNNYNEIGLVKIVVLDVVTIINI